MISKITLELIREVLYTKLGSASYIAGIIKKVAETDRVETLAISKAQTLYYNKKFIENNLKSEEHLFTVLMHEIFHPLFGHFNIEKDDTSNIAQDAFINASLFHLFRIETDSCSLMQSLYNKNNFEGLLRPFSNLSSTKYNAIYNLLYSSYNKVSSSEVMEILEQTIQKQKIKILLGNHGESLPDDGDGEDAGTINEKVAQEILSKVGDSPGHNTSMLDALKEVLNIHITLKTDILRKFAVKRTFDAFLEKNEVKRITRSPFPISPNRTDILMLMFGYDVIFYNNIISDLMENQSGKINVYLDVSGSVEPEINLILGLMRNIKNKINKIYLFSNKCVEAKIEDVCAGSIITTYGTSFDCVAESIIENNIEKALIFTDGYASLRSELQRQLKEKNPELMVVLFCNGVLYANTFEQIATIVKLGDIVC